MLLTDYYQRFGAKEGTDQGMPGMLPGMQNPRKVAPEGTSNMQVTPEMGNEGTMAPEVPGHAAPVEPDGGAQIMAVTPGIESLYQKLDNGVDPYTALLNARYEDQKQDIEKERKSSLLGNIASVFGQMVASSQGARKFDKVQPTAPKYYEQLRRLKAWKNNADLAYTLSKARQDLEEKRYQERMKMERERIARAQANADRSFQFQVDQSRRNQENWERDFGFRKDHDEWTRQEAEQTRRANEAYRQWLRDQRTWYPNVASSGSGAVSGVPSGAVSPGTGKGGAVARSRKDVFVLPVARADGSVQQVEIDKTKENLLIPLYDKIRESIVEKRKKIEEYNKTKEGKKNPIEIPFDMDEISITTGAVDGKNDKIAMVYKYLPMMPELAKEVNRLFGDVVSVPDEASGSNGMEGNTAVPEPGVSGSKLPGTPGPSYPDYGRAVPGSSAKSEQNKPGNVGVYGSMIPGQEGPKKLDLSSFDVPFEQLSPEQQLQRLKWMRYRHNTEEEQTGNKKPGQAARNGLKGSLLPGSGGKKSQGSPKGETKRKGTLLP